MSAPTDATSVTAAEQAAVTVRGVSRSFGSTRALRDVSFSIAHGEIHALLGENGSGKSTLVKILAGVYRADAGTIDRMDRSVSATDMTPEVAESLGLRFVHQNPSTFGAMTVAENIALGTHFPTRARTAVRWRELRRHTQELLDRFGINARPGTLVEDLRQADQTMIAIARALHDSDERHGLVLVLDEPTAALPEHEVEILLDSLRHCVSLGHTIIYVSHRIEEVMSLAHSVTVLRDGVHVVTRGVQNLTEAELIGHIVGRPLDSMFARDIRTTVGDRPMLEVRHVSGGPLRDVSFSARSGEIVGIAGLLGSGRTELLLTIFGAYRRGSGEIEVEQKPVRLRSPADAMRAGISYVPEDRHKDALFVTLSVRENITITRLRAYWSRWRLSRSREQRDTQRSIEEFSIRTEGPSAPLFSLSGGNQQKTVLARWLAREPKVLLLDEPTQGVDVGARADVYASIRAAVARGMTVILVTSDFDELSQVSDRILVLRDGAIQGELDTRDLDRRRITEAVYAMSAAGPVVESHRRAN
jgi:ribose transport system ATP-binding protein